MKLARLEEDRPTPPEVYNWRVYFNAIIATFAAVMIGYVIAQLSFVSHSPRFLTLYRYDSAFIGTSISLASFKSEFSLMSKTATEFDLISANIVSLYQAGYAHLELRFE